MRFNLLQRHSSAARDVHEADDERGGEVVLGMCTIAASARAHSASDLQVLIAKRRRKSRAEVLG